MACPCKLAKFIRVAFQTNEIITDRSTFSKLEVEAGLQGGGSALFQRAFYVVYDGFIPSELNNFSAAPSIDFSFTTGGSVPGMTATLADIELEDPSKPSEIPQKVTFIFDVNFANSSAFGFADPSQDVNISATLGQNAATAVINFIKAPNPYMVDGTTTWLSVDLRVFQLRQGQVKSTITQGASGNDFISSLLDRFNALPDNDYHPFKSITIDQDESRLELSETVGGTTVFNYAIAKVRYKAPVPTLPPPDANDAKDVKVFFRMFNTAGTAMHYNAVTTYRRAGTGANTISLIGKEETRSVPFHSSPPPVSIMRLRRWLRKRMTRTGEQCGRIIISNQWLIFGCWLDINRDINKLIPLNPTTDGPFPQQ
jgi:hypothetical protein